MIIAGVSRDSAFGVENAIKNIEQLGGNFNEYAVIIYENNSSDETPRLYADWASKNPFVDFISEILPQEELAKPRTERIAYARNNVLARARADKYKDFDYFISVDLDFTSPWPIKEILETMVAPYDWDCVSANGVCSGSRWDRYTFHNGAYWDRYAYRGKDYPFGPELLGDEEFWDMISSDCFEMTGKDSDWFEFTGKDWVPVFSAFGGLAIYKMKSIISFTYSGVVTEDLEKYYRYIISTVPSTNSHLRKYLEINTIQVLSNSTDIPIVFRENARWNSGRCTAIRCCEHLPLHASMALNGYGKFYVNPCLYLHYTN